MEFKWKENLGQSSKFQLQMQIKSRNVFKIDDYLQKVTLFTAQHADINVFYIVYYVEDPYISPFK